jgi:hypothetical protein
MSPRTSTSDGHDGTLIGDPPLTAMDANTMTIAHAHQAA